MRRLLEIIIIWPAVVVSVIGGLVWALIVAFFTPFVEAFQRRFGRRKGATHGDADWASPKQLKQAGHYEPKGWLVGFHEKRVYTHPEASVLGMAPKGQGKTQSAIAAVLDLVKRESKADLVIGDPAGDIHAATVSAIRAAGYRLIVLDFAKPLHTDKYDVLSFLRPLSRFDFDRDVDALCQLILPDDAHSREAHFQEFSRILLAGALAHMLVHEPDTTTLYSTVERLTTDAKQRRLMFDDMRKNASAITRQAINAFDEAGDREKGSFSTTMTRKLKVWLREAVKEVTSTGSTHPDGSIDRGWTWEQIFTDAMPTCVFVRAGLGTDEGAPSRLVYGNAINTRRRMWNHHGGTFPRELRILVDEARTIGNCNAIMDANNELRKAGVSLMLWYLSLKDVRDIFPQADTLIAGCNLVFFGGSNEFQQYEEASRLIGDKTIESASRSESDHGESRGVSEQARRLIKPDELRRLPYDQCVVVLGTLALKCKKAWQKGKDGIKYL